MTDPRPFYHRFAWAYNLLLNEPIGDRVTAIIALLSKRRVRPPDTVLDAGCGTGRYASALARYGFHVLGVDRSAELVKVAQAQPDADTGSIKFSVGDLTAFKWPGQFEAILRLNRRRHWGLANCCNARSWLTVWETVFQPVRCQ